MRPKNCQTQALDHDPVDLGRLHHRRDRQPQERMGAGLHEHPVPVGHQPLDRLEKTNRFPQVAPPVARVQLGPRKVGCPDDWIDTYQNLVLSGATTDEIREWVRSLKTVQQHAAPAGA